MSQSLAIGVVSVLCALVLVGGSILRQRRRGVPIGRYALIWLGFFALAFAVALWAPRSH